MPTLVAAYVELPHWPLMQKLLGPQQSLSVLHEPTSLQQKPKLGSSLLAQIPLQQRLSLRHADPVGRHPRPPTQVPLLEQSPLQHCVSLLQCLPLRLQPGGSAVATPPTPSDASVPPTRAAPINLRALRRDTPPLARALASSSKERLEVSWLTCCPHSPQGRDSRGLVPPLVDQRR